MTYTIPFKKSNNFSLGQLKTKGITKARKYTKRRIIPILDNSCIIAKAIAHPIINKLNIPITTDDILNPNSAHVTSTVTLNNNTRNKKIT